MIHLPAELFKFIIVGGKPSTRTTERDELGQCAIELAHSFVAALLPNSSGNNTKVKE